MELEQRAQKLLKSRTTGTQKEWSEYTPQEKRIAIAYDVIQALLAGVYTPQHWGYINEDKLESIGAANAENCVRTLFSKELVMDLEVDIIGALFMSLVRFENNFTLFTDEADFVILDEYPEPNAPRPRLDALFGDFQLRMMESAWEGSSFGGEPDIDICTKWGIEYLYGTSKLNHMLAILINITSNNGTFNPIPENVNAD